MNLCAHPDCPEFVHGTETLCWQHCTTCSQEGCDTPVGPWRLLCDVHLIELGSEEPRSIWTLKAGEQSPTEHDLEVDRLTAALNATRGELTAMRSRWLRVRVDLRALLETLEAL